MRRWSYVFFFFFTQPSIRLFSTCPVRLLLNPLPASLLEEWHTEKNNKLGLPSKEKIDQASVLNAWWKCNTCGKEWQAAVAKRTGSRVTNQSTLGGWGCPRCAEVHQSSSAPLLIEKHPQIAAEWDEEFNLQLSGNGTTHTASALVAPSKVLSNSSVRVRWRCSKCGIGWSARICDRVKGKAACPHCSLVHTTNSKTESSRWLSSRPDLVCELEHRSDLMNASSTLSETLASLVVDPEDTPIDSTREVHWQCGRCDHRYVASVRSRCCGGKRCPACCEGKVKHPSNLLHLARPDVFNEVAGFVSRDTMLRLTTMSNRVFLFVCPICHSGYRMSIRERCFAFAGCPICRNNQFSHRRAQKREDPKFTPSSRRRRIFAENPRTLDRSQRN